MGIIRKWGTVGLALAALGASGTSVQAAGYPDKPITVIVNMSPGGGTDTVARIVTQKASEILGQTLVVENKPGASGTIGLAAVARAKPDGYTLCWTSNAHSITPSVMPLNYDPLKDFAPVVQVSESPDVVVVTPKLGVKTIQEFVALAKSQPGKLNYASPGTATSPNVETLLFKKMTGIDIVGVPYKGGGESMPALLGGAVQVYFSTLSTALAHIKEGNLVPLAITTKERSHVLPDVPTVAEALNLPDFVGSDWLGVLAPAGTPPEIVKKLNNAIVEALQDDAIKKRLTGIGWTLIGNTPEQFAKVIAGDVARWKAAAQ